MQLDAHPGISLKASSSRVMAQAPIQTTQFACMSPYSANSLAAQRKIYWLSLCIQFSYREAQERLRITWSVGGTYPGKFDSHITYHYLRYLNDQAPKVTRLISVPPAGLAHFCVRLGYQTLLSMTQPDCPLLVSTRSEQFMIAMTSAWKTVVCSPS